MCVSCLSLSPQGSKDVGKLPVHVFYLFTVTT